MEGLKDKVLNFLHITVLEILNKLESNRHVLAYTQKQNKLTKFNCEWDQSQDIESYFTKVDDLEEELEDSYGLTIPEILKITMVMNQLANSGVLTTSS